MGSFGSFFHNLGHHIASLFGGHKAQIQNAIKFANVAVVDAIAVANATGHGDVTKILSGVGDGLSQISATVEKESSATTLAEAVKAGADLVTNLAVTTSDIGIKNETLKSHIQNVLVQTNNVVGSLETAHAAEVGSLTLAPVPPVPAPSDPPPAPETPVAGNASGPQGS